jgi:hypothetical protein
MVRTNLRLVWIAVAALVSAHPGPAMAQNSPAGSIEILVAATPTGGRPEAAPRMPVFLLRKSFAEIQKEAEAETPPPNMAEFVDSLEVSPELKEWMKRKKTVRLNGPEFVRQLTANDIADVPEFWEAYLTRNGQDVTVGFPRAKFKEADRSKNPEKFDQERKEYRERVKKYLQSFAHTKEGIDLHLTSVDPGHRWAQKEGDRKASVRQQGLLLAQTKYLLARTETDLQGRGGFVRVTAGAYWISTLENEAVAGDVRLRWDLPVEVRAGAATTVELSNINAVPRVRR